VGLGLGLLIISVEFAGSLMDTQAGLSVAAILDPATGRSVPLFSQTLNWVALMIFLQLDGHHLLMTMLVKSFQLLPIGMSVNLSKAGLMIASLGTEIFKIGVIISAPILLVIFIVDFAFGLLNKIAEQINVFQLGFQVKPTVALIVFLALTPGLASTINHVMETLSEKTLTILVALQG
jgi:flagellar biosynthetic protein FliR